jgi:hypothetical protein
VITLAGNEHQLVCALPPLRFLPKEREFNDRSDGTILGVKIGKPKVKRAVVYTIRAMSGGPIVGRPNNRRLCQDNYAQNSSMEHSPDRMMETPKLISVSDRINGISLKSGFNAIKAGSVVSAADQRYVFGVGPAQRHGRARWKTAARMPVWQIIGIPQLLAEHASFIGEVFQRHNEWFRVISRGEFVVPSFAG